MMNKPKTRRPHLWKVQGEVPHQQFRCWQQMRAQASFRGEEFELTLEQYQEIWGSKWEFKGRGIDDYCLTRVDMDLGWTIDNTQCVKRLDHLQEHRRRQRQGYYNGKRNKVHTKTNSSKNSVS